MIPFLLLKLTDQREEADVLERVSEVGPQPPNALWSPPPVQMSTAVRPVDSLTGRSVRADTSEAAGHRQRWEDSDGTVWWWWGGVRLGGEERKPRVGGGFRVLF